MSLRILWLILILVASCSCHCKERDISEVTRKFESQDYTGLRKALQPSCDASLAEACFLLGKLYYNGWDGEEDVQGAETYYQKACVGGSDKGCIELANIYSDGINARNRTNPDLTDLRQQCTPNRQRVCAELASIYANIGYENYQADMAAKLAKSTCDSQIGKGCLVLGSLYFSGRSVEKSKAKAILHFELGCKYGHSSACVYVGATLEETARSPEALRRVQVLYESACNAGEGFGCANLGVLYHRGRLGITDHNKALKYSQMACALKVKVGCENAAKFLSRHNDNTQILNSTDLAKKCDLGDSNACNNLATSLVQSPEKEQHGILIRHLFEKSCNLQNAIGCYNLANVFEDGIGGEKSYKNMAANMRKACKLSLQQACARVPELKN